MLAPGDGKGNLGAVSDDLLFANWGTLYRPPTPETLVGGHDRAAIAKAAILRPVEAADPNFTPPTLQLADAKALLARPPPEPAKLELVGRFDYTSRSSARHREFGEEGGGDVDPPLEEDEDVLRVRQRVESVTSIVSKHAPTMSEMMPEVLQPRYATGTVPDRYRYSTSNTGIRRRILVFDVEVEY